MIPSWKIDGVPMEYSPVEANPIYEKSVSYERSPDGHVMRRVSDKHPVSKSLEIKWALVSESFRNYIHDLFVSDQPFYLESHLYPGDPRERWKVRIDELMEEYRERGKIQRFNLRALCKILDATNDPTIIHTVNYSPYMLIFNNPTNRTIHDYSMFVTGLNHSVKNLRITQLYNNSLSNPGFELHDWGAWEETGWELDVMMFRTGRKAAATRRLNTKLSQTQIQAPGAKFTLNWHCRSDSPGTSLKTAVIFSDGNRNVLTRQEMEVAPPEDWGRFTFTTNPAPASTRFVTVEFSLVAGDGYVYLDDVMGYVADEVLAHEAIPHRTLVINGEVDAGDTIKIDANSNLVTINEEEDISFDVQGFIFSLPPGLSMLLIEEDEFEEGDITEVVIRYDEVFE